MTKMEIAAALGVSKNTVSNTITRMGVPMLGTTEGRRRSKAGNYSLEAVKSAMEARKGNTLDAKRGNAEAARKARKAYMETEFLTLPQTVRLLRKKGYTAGRIAKITRLNLATIWLIIQKETEEQ